MTSLTRSFCITLFTMLMIGCAQLSGDQETDKEDVIADLALGEAPLSSEEYLQQASSASGVYQQGLLLLASRAALNENNLVRAAETLGKLPSPMQMPELSAERDLLTAELAISAEQTTTPIELLNKIDVSNLSVASHQQYLLLIANTQAKAGMPIEATKALIERDSLLTDPDQLRANRELIWQQLTNLTPFALRMFQEKPAPDPLSGWLEVVAVTKENMQDPNGLVAAMKFWQQQYPDHPAVDNMPEGLKSAISTQPYNPQKIAILLPQTGRYASQGEVIMQGVLHAYLSSFTQETEILFYDTAAQSIESIYAEIEASDVDFLVGPLLKRNLEKLLALDPQLPMLALNQLPELIHKDNRFFFALLPEDEARQAATRMWQDNLRHPAVIANASSIGKRMAENFVEEWQALTPEQDAPEIIYFSTIQQMQKTVRELLGIDMSQQRINHLRQVLNTSIESEARSRRDIDSIYLVGDPTETRLLKPFVDVNVSPFAKTLAIYASSRSLGSVTPGSKGVNDMQNVVISDIPLLLPGSDAQRGAMSMSQSLWPNRKTSEHRLFAFGYDALSLIDSLVQMRNFSEFQIDGYSGELRVDAQGLVNRKLVWAKIKNSGPQRLP